MNGGHAQQCLSIEAGEFVDLCLSELTRPDVATVQDDWSDTCLPEVRHEVGFEAKAFMQIST